VSVKSNGGITASTRKLLRSREGQHLDFKETIQALDVDDLAAFANASGGTILLGVAQRGGKTTVAGCAWDDKAELAVRQKADAADPPLAVDVSAENTARGKAILRVNIPSSANKPHGSPRGVLKIRDGNKNRNLRPQELLDIFLDSQSQAFFARFKAASEALENRLEAVSGQLRELQRFTNGMANEIEEHLQQTMGCVEDAVSNSDEALTRADEGAGETSRVIEMLDESRVMFEDMLIFLRQSAEQSGHDMPDVYRWKRHVRHLAFVSAATEPGKDDPTLFKTMSRLDKNNRARGDLSPEQFREAALKGFAAGREHSRTHPRLARASAGKRARAVVALPQKAAPKRVKAARAK
jgi:hypothetical protein